MKLFLFILILIGNVSLLPSQNKCNNTDSMVFGGPDELPVFSKELSDSDIENLMRFIVENIKYPNTAKKDSIEGTVVVEFWIETDGSTSEHKIIKSIREDLDKEALRVARLIKFNKPAMNREKPVGMCFKLPISFKLSTGLKSTCIKHRNRNSPSRRTCCPACETK